MSNEVNLGEIQKQILDGIRAEGREPVAFDLGCGQHACEGFVGLDYLATGENVKRSDLYTFPWTVDGVPMADGSVDYLRASHFVEHIPDWDAHFTEAYRVLKMGGHYEIITPYWSSIRAFMDPDHKQAISENRYLYLTRAWKKQNHHEHYGAQVNFSVRNGQFFYAWNRDYEGKSDEVREYALRHSLNVADDIAVILVKEAME